MEAPARVFAKVAAAVNDEMWYDERLKAWLAVLQAEFPGWEIWYVLQYPIGATWHARPRGCQDPSRTLHADGAVRLAMAVSEAAS